MKQRWFWLTVVLVTLASLVIGGSVQHFFDQRRSDRAFYRAQLTSTEYRFFAAENRQILLPVAQRSAPAFGDLGDSIGQDPGIDPDSTLEVELGTGSVKPFTQIAFEVTVSSPYASTKLVVWTARGPAGTGADDRDKGGCVLSSTLLGPGRAKTELDFGDLFVPACTPDMWRPSPVSALKPDLTLANIPVSGR